MSGSKVSSVRYVPSAAEVEAMQRRGFDVEVDRRRVLLGRVSEAEAEWADRAPIAAGTLASIRIVEPTADSDLVDATLVLRGEIDRAERRLGELVAACVAEEARAVLRQESTRDEVSSAAGLASVAGLGVRTRVGEFELGEEEASPASAVIEPGASHGVGLPDAADRVARVVKILQRDPRVAVETVERCVESAAAAETPAGYQTVLDVARAAVGETVREAARRDRDRETAAGLLESMGDLSSVELDPLHHELRRVLVDDVELPPRAVERVEAGVAAALRVRMVAVFEDLGMQPEVDGEATLAWMGHDDQTGSLVRVDGQGVVVTSVARTELGRADAVALDERNCEFFRDIKERLAGAGVVLDVTRDVAAGVIEPRVLPDHFVDVVTDPLEVPTVSSSAAVPSESGSTPKRPRRHVEEDRGRYLS